MRRIPRTAQRIDLVSEFMDLDFELRQSRGCGAGLVHARNSGREIRYMLTRKGEDFRPALWSLITWGNEYFALEGESVVIVDAATGKRADPVMIDHSSGRYGERR